MLKKIRISFAIVFFGFITLLFLDFTGTLHTWFGWMAKFQFMPAVLALNIGAIVLLVLLTLFLGRVYCSVICPLGIFQDIAARFGKWGKKMPYSFSLAKSWLRYSVLALFVAAIIFGVSVLTVMLDPYAAYGRMANQLFSPLWQWGNNLLAAIAERVDSYAFYTTDVWMKSLPTLIIAAVTFVVVVFLAWRNGRTYCNTICPVGTFLGFLSRFSLFKIRIDGQKCNKCRICERNCKAACINSKEFTIDYSRCVSCMNCINQCNRGAVGYKFVYPSFDEALKSINPVLNSGQPSKIDVGRKGFLIAISAFAASALKAQVILKATDIKVDGGLADILDKEAPDRLTPLTPAGSLSVRNMKRHCTACQLCVTVCPNSILRPSNSLNTWMQPFMSFERGYCRPECVKCSEVCPTGAINKISKEEKSSIQIGRAVWVRERCIPLVDEQECNTCEHHCPTSAIVMVSSVPGDDQALKIPAVNEELCIGCGTCEYLCPSRPLSAIYVEGSQIHRNI